MHTATLCTKEMMMSSRVSYQKAAPDVFQGLFALTAVVQKSGLAPGLIDLVNLRVSQINGCAYCLVMHSKDLRARGETEQRIYLLSAWREVPDLYDSRERAALAWAEAVTRLTDQDVSDEVYDQARKEFSDKELAQLTLGIVAINGWNRLNIAFRTPAGNYKSAIKQSAA
jgi:AhpD family alkylhydroperoxidase